MALQKKTKKVRVGQRELTFESGQIARQAHGAVLARMDDTLLFASVCRSEEPVESRDFMPLRVDYQEKFSSAGKTLGGFLKREGRPQQKEILTSRLIDRPIRPMFEEGFFHEVQILAYVWSYDASVSTSPLAINAASAALTISDIPLIKPIGAVQVGMIDGKFVLNPSMAEMERSTLDLTLAGTEDAVLMIEGYCDFLTEQQVVEAIDFGHSGVRTICAALKEWQQEIGAEKKRDTLIQLPEEVSQAVSAIATESRLSAIFSIADKKKRESATSALKEEVSEGLAEKEFDPQDVAKAFKNCTSAYLRKMVLEKNERCDGRGTDEIRSIYIEQSLLPRSHGSSLFTRGETQTMAVCTLGGKNMAQRYETLDEDSSFQFYLQYSFPPFSVGEVGRVGSPGRREIGHGKLAERALMATLPLPEDFPYTIRLESNITESNGSSSMATVCGGCLAMMNAGVPIKRPVSGIAMGLVLEQKKFVILSDILGVEDALGDMDFKITGDAEGITAFQMDIKVEGITPDIITAALAQAKRGLVHILEEMKKACPQPSALPAHAPRIEMLKVKQSKIGAIIGPGGKQIRAIVEETGVEIDIDDDGTVSLVAPDHAAIEAAKAHITALTAEVEIGTVYRGKIKAIKPFGLFVEFLPGKEGLCPIAEFSHEHVEDLNDLVKVGDELSVRVLDINERGQIRLSRKATLLKSK